MSVGGAVGTIFQLIDGLFTLSDVYQLVIAYWSIVFKVFWTWLASYFFDVPDLPPLDILFLTFMLFISLIVFSARMPVGEVSPAASGWDYLKGGSALLILMAVFALGDIAITAETIDRGLSFGGLQSFFLVHFNQWLNPFVEKNYDLPACISRFPDMLLFYCVASSIAMAALFAVLRLVSFRVDLAVLSSRVNAIVWVSFLLLVMNLVALAFYKGDVSGLFIGCTVT
ncbi:MAG: hypothetical protein AAGB04_03290 [Pseudomonadota bacterium]